MKQDSGMGGGGWGGADKAIHSSHTKCIGYFYREVCRTFEKVGHGEEGALLESVVSYFIFQVTAAQGSIFCLLLRVHWLQAQSKRKQGG